MPAYKHIQKQRKAKGLSQQAIADLLGPYWPEITKGMVSKSENNKRPIPIDEAPLWAAVLGCEIKDLVDPLPDPPVPVHVPGRRKPPKRRKKE